MPVIGCACEAERTEEVYNKKKKRCFIELGGFFLPPRLPAERLVCPLVAKTAA